MTPEQIALVQSSWQQVLPIQTQAAALFYGKLFELDPSLTHLFKGDMVEQGRKLMNMMATVVARLDEVGEIVPAVQALGRRHVGYGVEDRHYETVGRALLWTLATGLGAAFTDEVREAWTAAYVTLAGVMKEAAASAA